MQSCGFCLSLVVVFLAPPLLIDPACVQIFGFILSDVWMTLLECSSGFDPPLSCVGFFFLFLEKWENVHKAAFRLAIREASGKPRLKSSFPPGLKMLLAPPHHHHPVIPSKPPSVSRLASSLLRGRLSTGVECGWH